MLKSTSFARIPEAVRKQLPLAKSDANRPRSERVINRCMDWRSFAHHVIEHFMGMHGAQTSAAATVSPFVPCRNWRGVRHPEGPIIELAMERGGEHKIV